MTQPIDFSQPQRVPLIPALDSRGYDLMKDALLVNCIAEKQESIGGYKIRKRFGTGTPLYNFGGVGYGMYYWNNKITLYTVVRSGSNYNIYANGVLAFASSAGSGLFRYWDFEETSGSSRFLVLGTKLDKTYYIRLSDGLVTQITDADFPGGGRVMGLVHLNGRVYVMDTLGGIFGSAIDDPSSWDALNRIQARSDSDLAVALVKHMSYVVAFKERTMEFFYDAGNAVGSSLSLAPGLHKTYGCLSPDTIRDAGGDLYWVSVNRTRSPQVVKMSNAQIQVISTPSVERALGILSSSGFGSNSLTSLTAVCFKSAGHSFYSINLPATTGLRPCSLVYDISEDLWHIWSKEDTQNPGNQINLGYVFDSSNNIHQYLQDPVTGAAVPFGSDDLYTSDTNSLAIASDIITPNFDLGTKRWKVLSRLSFGMDEQSASEILVRYNDHDYDDTKWSRFRAVSLNQTEPFLKNEGRFRRRAYHFRHTDNTKMRLSFVDMQLSLGAI